MTLSELSNKMQRYNLTVAYGGECNAWGDFVADSYDRLDIAPWDDRAENTNVPDDMAEYWVDVTDNDNDDYDETGSRVES